MLPQDGDHAVAYGCSASHLAKFVESILQTWQERVDCKMALGSLRTCWWELMRGAIRKDMLKKYGAPLWATIEVILRSGGGSRERMQRALNLVRASLS